MSRSRRLQRGRRGRRGLATASLMLLLVLSTCGAVWAAYTGSATSSGNELVAAADWVAPSASGSVLAKTQGGVPGFIRQGGSYYVYANVTDSGAPASGVASIAANVSTVTTGQTASALSSGSFPIGGSTYGYRTASLTANATLAAGTYEYSLTSKDASGNSRTQAGYTVTVDNTAPTASDVQTTNKSGNTAGKPELGDSIVFTFSEPIDPNSILASWTGEATSVTVRINNATNDTLLVYNAANATQLPLGSVNLGRTDYVTANATFGATGTPSTMVMSANTVTVTLGTASSGTSTAAAAGTMVWTPSASAYDRAGNAETTTTRSETGSSDRDF